MFHPRPPLAQVNPPLFSSSAGPHPARHFGFKGFFQADGVGDVFQNALRGVVPNCGQLYPQQGQRSNEPPKTNLFNNLEILGQSWPCGQERIHARPRDLSGRTALHRASNTTCVTSLPTRDLQLWSPQTYKSGPKEKIMFSSSLKLRV